MAIMELVTRYRYQDQQMINRFNFISNGTPAAVSLSFALTFAFGAIPAGEPPAYPLTGLFEFIRDVQVSGVTYDEVQARDMYSTLDFYTLPFPAGVVGNNPESGEAPFEALGFASNRVRSDINRGYKRFGGIPTSFVGAGGVLVAGGISVGNLLAGKLGDVLEYDDEGNTITFTPCVLSLEKYSPAPGRTAYRPYATAAEQLEHTAVGVIYGPYSRIRSQVSRQVGHGR